MRTPFLILAFCTIILISPPLISHVYGVDTPEEMLANPQDEQRAEELGARLRCLVCQNESIEESSAPLARDLRHIVRLQIQNGKNNQEILNWMTKRYGDFIRLEPRFTLENALLWLIPLLTLMIGFYYAHKLSTRPILPSAPLTEEEEKKLLHQHISLEDHTL